MVQTLLEFLREYFPPELRVFIISMLPILELRGGLVAASLLGVSWPIATVISVVGNILPIPFILLFVKRILYFLGQTKIFHKIAQKYESKAATKGAEMIEKYPRRLQLALLLFVAIPLPGTGAWTGALVASFLNLPAKRSFPAIAAGVLGAAGIMLILTYGVPYVVGLL